MIVQWNISSGAYVATLPGYPKDRPWGVKWRNPGALVENCPEEYQGFGYGPATVTTTLGANEEWDGEPNYSAGSLVDGEWRCTRPKRTADLTARKTAMKETLSGRFQEVVAAGKVVNGTTIDISSEGFTRLEQARNVVPVNAVTSRREPIDLPDTATVDAILAAGRAQYKAIVQRERALYDAIDDAANHAALDLIDIAAGSIDDSGAWPSP